MSLTRSNDSRYLRASVRYVGCLVILLTLVSVTAVTGGVLGDPIGTQNTATNESLNESDGELFLTVDADETGALGETVNATLIAIAPDEDQEIDWFNIQVDYDNSYLAFDTAHEAEAGPVTVTDGGPGYAVFENEYELGDGFIESVTTPVAIATVSFTVIGSDGNATITADERSSVGWGVDLLQTEYDVEWDTGTVKTHLPNGTITGTVTNATGTPIHNATVSTSDTTTTATNGTYNLSVPDGNTTVTASADGYGKETTAVSVTGDETTTQSFTLSQSDDEDNDAGDDNESTDEDEGTESDGDEEGTESDGDEEKNGSDDHENGTESDSGEDENTDSERNGQSDSEQAEDTEDSSGNTENFQFSGSSSQTTNTSEESATDEDSTAENTTRNESDDGADLNDSQPNENESDTSSDNKSSNSTAGSDNGTTTSDTEASLSVVGSESTAIQPVGTQEGSPSLEPSTDDTPDEPAVSQSGVLLYLGHGVGATGILIGAALILYRSGKRAVRR